MGKNPNAKKLKEKKHKEREFGQDVSELETEALKQGVEVWELDEVKKQQKKLADDGSDKEESSEEEEVVNKKKGGKGFATSMLNKKQQQ